MNKQATFNERERSWLWAIAVVGLLGPNGVFVYHLLFRQEVLVQAIGNPVALTFILEAFLLVGLLAYLFSKLLVNPLGWRWFIALSLLGGLLFAVPAFLLMARRDLPRKVTGPNQR